MISHQPPLRMKVVSLLLCPLIPCGILQVCRVTRARLGTALQTREGQEWNKGGLDQEGHRESSGGRRWFCQWALFGKSPCKCLQHPPHPPQPHTAGLLPEIALILCSRPACLAREPWLGWAGPGLKPKIMCGFITKFLNSFICICNGR